MNKKVYCADLTHTGNGTMALTFPLGASYVVSYAKKILGKEFDFKLFKYQNHLGDSCWGVCPDQEDGAVEVRISSGDPTPPNLWGTPLFICYMSLSH